jgi:hypothetical protein
MCKILIYLQTLMDKIYYFFFSTKNNTTKMKQPLVEVKHENMDTRLLEYHAIYPDKQIYI